MTPKQSAFIAEYLIFRNASEAARRAGYSAKRADAIGYDLLRNTEVAAAINAGMKKLATGLEITAERVQKERARLAFFDVSKLFDAEGRPLPINQIDADTRAAIVGIDVVDGELSTVRKYRLATKDASLAALERHFGLLEKPIAFKLPSIGSIQDCVAAQANIIQAVAAGTLLPSEGDSLSALVENHRRALETSSLETRLEAIEEQLRTRT